MMNQKRADKEDRRINLNREYNAFKNKRKDLEKKQELFDNLHIERKKMISDTLALTENNRAQILDTILKLDDLQNEAKVFINYSDEMIIEI